MLTRLRRCRQFSALRLLASIEELTSKLEHYSTNARSRLSESNAEFAGYAIYSEVNPEVPDGDDGGDDDAYKV